MALANAIHTHFFQSYIYKVEKQYEIDHVGMLSIQIEIYLNVNPRPIDLQTTALEFKKKDHLASRGNKV